MRIELPYPNTLTDNVDTWVQYISDLPNPSKGGAHRTGKK